MWIDIFPSPTALMLTHQHGFPLPQAGEGGEQREPGEGYKSMANYD